MADRPRRRQRSADAPISFDGLDLDVAGLDADLSPSGLSGFRMASACRCSGRRHPPEEARQALLGVEIGEELLSHVAGDDLPQILPAVEQVRQIQTWILESTRPRRTLASWPSRYCRLDAMNRSLVCPSGQRGRPEFPSGLSSAPSPGRRRTSWSGSAGDPATGCRDLGRELLLRLGDPVRPAHGTMATKPTTSSRFMDQPPCVLRAGERCGDAALPGKSPNTAFHNTVDGGDVSRQNAEGTLTTPQSPSLLSRCRTAR